MGWSRKGISRRTLLQGTLGLPTLSSLRPPPAAGPGPPEISAAGRLPGGAVRLSETDRNTYQVRWARARLELNLWPMNRKAVEGNEYRVRYAEGKIMDGVADAVGVIALQLEGLPPVSRICWDSREHHLWDGFTGGFELRNTVIHDPKVVRRADGSADISAYFVANDVRTDLNWRFPGTGVSDTLPARWDTRIEVTNQRTEILPGYLQLFACYHPPGTNYYWDVSNQIRPCGKTVFLASRSPEETTKFRNSQWNHLLHYFEENPEVTSASYRKPVLLSEKQPWFGGLRHVLLVEPGSCATLITAHDQARDYWIRPPGDHLAPGGSFVTRVRHLITRVEDASDLERLWADFESELQVTS